MGGVATVTSRPGSTNKTEPRQQFMNHTDLWEQEAIDGWLRHADERYDSHALWKGPFP